MYMIFLFIPLSFVSLVTHYKILNYKPGLGIYFFFVWFLFCALVHILRESISIQLFKLLYRVELQFFFPVFIGELNKEANICTVLTYLPFFTAMNWNNQLYQLHRKLQDGTFTSSRPIYHRNLSTKIFIYGSANSLVRSKSVLMRRAISENLDLRDSDKGKRNCINR